MSAESANLWPMRGHSTSEQDSGKRRHSRWRWRSVALAVVLFVVAVPLVAFGVSLSEYARDVRAAAPFYAGPGVPVDDGQRVELSAVQSVKILPLIDWYAASPGLETEAGLSYLVQADQTTVLLDLGFNAQHSIQPPLLRNMDRLGIDPSTVDFVVISHPHADHLNGSPGQQAILRTEDDPLAGKPVYSTIDLKVTGGTSTVVDHPRALAPGVGTTGAVPVGLFGSGYTLEQSVVVNLAGKGLVLVAGCGHPGVDTLVRRAEQVYQMPVYAFFGGAHLMAHDGRVHVGPVATQKFLASSTPPWAATSEADVLDVVDFLHTEGVQQVGLSAHDADDWTLQTFTDAFGTAYRPIRVGEAITL